MKWFKHHTDASRSEKLMVLIDKFGVEGYGRYWLLVELLAEKFDGKDANFRIHNNTIKRGLFIYHGKMVQRLLECIDDVGLMSLSCSDDIWSIYCPKLLEIKDNHTRNLQVKTKLVAPRIEENRIDNIKGKVKSVKPSVKSKFDIDLIYAEYPKKQGKKKGIEKLHDSIKTQESYDIILQGTRNYKNYCLEENIGMKFIKQFSTFVNGEHWNDEYVSESQSNEIKTQNLIDEVEEMMNRGF